VTLTEDEQEVICGLRLISSSIEKLVLVQGPGRRSNERIMMVKLAEFRDAIPFKSLGAGMNHLLGVFLALIKARESVLLIDELENGVHYSVQPVLWDLIFKQAANLNIQVFVTTHSWDCVEGFQIAANKQSDTSAVVVRLEEHKGSVKGVLFSSQEIEIARRENIEVR